MDIKKQLTSEWSKKGGPLGGAGRGRGGQVVDIAEHDGGRHAELKQREPLVT